MKNYEKNLNSVTLRFIVTSLPFSFFPLPNIPTIHFLQCYTIVQLPNTYKSPLSNLRNFLAIVSHLRMMKNALYLTSKSFFVHKICGVLRDLVAFAQFKKREKHPWRSVNFSKVAGYAPNI